MAEVLTRRYPEMVVSEMAKKARAGKVFVDWSQNAEHKSTVAVYSLRAKGEEPFVSMPISWPALKRALSNRDPTRFCITPEEALKRVSRDGDIFGPTLHLRQNIPAKLL
jgi:bifunctional non-homologous end joining protein LigD